jgi:hypothetical protein
VQVRIVPDVDAVYLAPYRAFFLPDIFNYIHTFFRFKLTMNAPMVDSKDRTR